MKTKQRGLLLLEFIKYSRSYDKKLFEKEQNYTLEKLLDVNI